MLQKSDKVQMWNEFKRKIRYLSVLNITK